MSDKNSGHSKDGKRRRTTSTKGERGGGMPPIMWLAIVVCVVGAVFLFRSQNVDVPTGIGENRTVVTAPDVESTLEQAETPRSGDVDITAAAQEIVPEKSADPATETQPEAVVTKPPVKKSTPPTTTTAQPAADLIKPIERGPYVVQAGSFGKVENADKEAARLQEKGWDARVKMGNTSDGALIYRVRIGYFKSRADAEKFIRQNRRAMSGAIAVHR